MDMEAVAMETDLEDDDEERKIDDSSEILHLRRARHQQHVSSSA